MSNFSEKQKAIMIKKHHKKFQESRLKIIKKIKLSNIMKKNPYLYAARNFQTSKELVDSILRDLITSSDETIFGDVFFEPLGMEISKGNVSVGKGTDFSVETNSEIIVYSFKSGSNVQNASATEKQGQEFTETSQRLRKINKPVDNVRIHGYGKSSSKAKSTKPFRQVSGQAAWNELSGCSDFFIFMNKIIQEESEKYGATYNQEYEKKLSEIINEFDLNFPAKNGKINWDAVTEFNSGINSRGKRLKKIES